MSEQLIFHFQSTLSLVLYMSLLPLLTAMVVGLIVGILQAVTQVQDQSLPMTFKLLAVIVLLLFGGSLLAVPLEREAAEVFDSFPALTR
ncbi:EscS/YscS/HrcS family type III secretion system export apparatus protein [Acetobacter pasteurianus]|uniref:EscS/YscS/HrcS family type III secretion system export apparatus protein n=1 Tax=Acetobacter pasteurianus TaxID=438 RepID=UPI003D14C552